MKLPQTMEEQHLLVELAAYCFGRLTPAQVHQTLAEYGMVKVVDGQPYLQGFLTEKYANQCFTHFGYDLVPAEKS